MWRNERVNHIMFLVCRHREEDEFEESDGLQSNKSNDDGSINDNTLNYSNAVSVGECAPPSDGRLSAS